MSISYEALHLFSYFNHSSDWTLDLTHPRVDVNEGWQYARTFDDPDDQWVAEPPATLERVLSGAGVLTPALAGGGGSSSAGSQPINVASSSRRPPRDNVNATTWVRRRRWIRVLRRRLDISPLPFLQPDGGRYYLGIDGSLVPAHDQYGLAEDGEQEMGVVHSGFGSNSQDYVSRARYLAGTQRKGSVSVGLDNAGTGVNGEIVSSADLRRAIGRLERAALELRAGMLGTNNCI